MIEDVIELEENKVQILKSAHPWQHIRPIGGGYSGHRDDYSIKAQN